MLTPKKWLIPMAIAVAISLASGCGRLTTAPVVTGPGAVATGTQATGTQATGPAPARVIESEGLIGDIGTILSDVTHLVFRTLDIVGNVGGSLTNGRWRVDVPPNAVVGNATVRIGIPSPTSSACQLEITPVSKNHFDTPVQLTVDCRSVPRDRLVTYVVFWHDPTTDKWVPVPGSSVDLQAKTVSAPLQHFSQYAVGPVEGRGSW